MLTACRDHVAVDQRTRSSAIRDLMDERRLLRPQRRAEDLPRDARRADLHAALLPHRHHRRARHRQARSGVELSEASLPHIGILEEEKVGRDKIFLHRKYLDVLFSDGIPSRLTSAARPRRLSATWHVADRMSRATPPPTSPPSSPASPPRRARPGAIRPPCTSSPSPRPSAPTTSSPSSTPAIACSARTGCRRPRRNGRRCASAIPASSCI